MSHMLDGVTLGGVISAALGQTSALAYCGLAHLEGSQSSMIETKPSLDELVQKVSDCISAKNNSERRLEVAVRDERLAREYLDINTKRYQEAHAALANALKT